jgi:dTDP-4-dehydrorhamnose 3,5-epimerase
MIFKETEIKGVFIIEPQKHQDERGFFARAWCQKEFLNNGLSGHVAQVNTSYNKRKGTLRGMHYQQAPYEEIKLIRCTAGAIYDVVVDIRPNSATYMRWLGVELTSSNYRMLYVPENLAHGYQTLEDDSEVTYQVSEFYTPHAEAGIRYDDPVFGIRWPVETTSISEKDLNWPDFTAK